ncbi:MAG TPA: glycosyltransferase family A protein [Puia sp.]|nr:glycosyltransferase family A protein [Puia sp.]
MSLLVIVPARGRKANCERLLESFRETAGNADTEILVITDPDDQETYEDMDWGNAQHAVMSPRGSYIEKLNHGWNAFREDYDAFMCLGDSNVFITSGWDVILLKMLDSLGGSGWVYPENGRRRDIPEHWLASADVTRMSGWLAPPDVKMYYGDNIIADLGKSSGLLRYCPEAVIEHRHYSVTGEERDATYAEAEDTHGEPDREAYLRWRAGKMPHQVARLRREFNPDIKWILGRI